MFSGTWRRSSSRPGLLVGALVACTAACSSIFGGGPPERTPLQKVLEQDAPNYQVKAPAIDEANLGARLVNAQPETNACFKGFSHDGSLQGWKERSLDYTGSADAKLKMDLGGAITANASAGGKQHFSVLLKKVSLVRLDSVYFVPEGNCADMLDTPAANDTFAVITRALKAASVDVKRETQAAGSIGVDVNKLGGALSGSTGNVDHWTGTSLYFAHLPERLQVTRKDVQEKELTAGDATDDLDGCAFKLRAVTERWDGVLTCMGGRSYSFEGKELNVFETVSTGPGVSYTVRVRKGSGLGLARVELHRFNARTI